MKVLFSHSYFYQFDAKQWANKTPYPPLGTITAAAYLKQKGYEVDLFDTALLDGPESLEAVLDRKEFDLFVVYDDGFNYLTKMCLTNMREAAFEMAKMAKKNGLHTVVCSSDSTDHFEKYLENGFDHVIFGEGELTLLELADAYKNGNDTNSIIGTANKDKNNGKRPVLNDLDELPQADWSLIDVASYRRVWESGGNRFTLNLATTRGCPFKCNWCAKPIYGQRYNTRSPNRVVAEIERHVKEHNVTHFWMCDDIFGLKPGWVQAFRDELKSRNLKITYFIQSRADLLLQDDNMDALVESGLREVWIGAESGSQKILDAMDKGTTLEQIKISTEKLQSRGVKVAYFLQFGYLGETKDDIDLTFKMLEANMPDTIGVSVSYPLPGTPFYDKVKNELGGKQNWEDSDDLAMMFRSTFKPEYYKLLHRYVHKRYRKVQAKAFFKSLFKGKLKPSALKVIIAYPYYLVNEWWYRSKLNRLA